MNGARDDFLADTAFAGDEHFRVGSRDAVNLLFERQNLRASARELHVSPRPRRRGAGIRTTSSVDYSVKHWL